MTAQRIAPKYKLIYYPYLMVVQSDAPFDQAVDPIPSKEDVE